MTTAHAATVAHRAGKIGKGMEEFGKHSLHAPAGQGMLNNLDDVSHY